MLTCFFLFAENATANGSTDKLFSKNDMVNNKTTVYLQQIDLITDSVTFHDLNFAVDSLTRIKDHLWSYVFSVRCGSDCKLRKQVILMSHNRKLRVSYVNYFSSSYDYRELYANNLQMNGLKTKLAAPVGFCSYAFMEKSVYATPTIKEYIYKGKTEDNGTKGTVNYYTLKYDTLQTIFFTKHLLLSGGYVFITPGSSDRQKKKMNQLLPAFVFKESVYIFYENNWHELNAKTKQLVKFY